MVRSLGDRTFQPRFADGTLKSWPGRLGVLAALDLGGNPLEDAGAIALASALFTNTTLTEPEMLTTSSSSSKMTS